MCCKHQILISETRGTLLENPVSHFLTAASQLSMCKFNRAATFTQQQKDMNVISKRLLTKRHFRKTLSNTGTLSSLKLLLF